MTREMKKIIKIHISGPTTSIRADTNGEDGQSQSLVTYKFSLTSKFTIMGSQYVEFMRQPHKHLIEGNTITSLQHRHMHLHSQCTQLKHVGIVLLL